MGIINWRNFIVITGLVTVVVFIGLVESRDVSDRRPPASPQASGGTTAATVTFSDQDFDPTTVTIKTGQAVIWVNQSDWPMWVASDPHPSHVGLPGFDQRQLLRRGAHWQFTFNQPGQYNYHDHLNPTRRGKVIVE